MLQEGGGRTTDNAMLRCPGGFRPCTEATVEYVLLASRRQSRREGGEQKGETLHGCTQ